MPRAGSAARCWPASSLIALARPPQLGPMGHVILPPVADSLRPSSLHHRADCVHHLSVGPAGSRHQLVAFALRPILSLARSSIKQHHPAHLIRPLPGPVTLRPCLRSPQVQDRALPNHSILQWAAQSSFSRISGSVLAQCFYDHPGRILRLC